MKAIAGAVAPQREWHVYFAENNAENRFQARMLLREHDVERFRYQTQYSISTDSMMLRVSGVVT